MIEVLDAQLDAALLNDLHALSKSIHWQFGWASSREDMIRFWHSDLRCLNESDQGALDNIERAILSITGRGHSVVRRYANGHTYGCGSSIHTDGQGRVGFKVVVLFAHPKWEKNWGGELNFYSDRDECIHSITPNPGRIILFSGDVRHAVSSPSRSSSGLRVSLVWKLEAIPGFQRA